MQGWSEAEATRTVDEVKRRSLVDPMFRALALSNPSAAMAKVNPKPLPEKVQIRFVERGADRDLSQFHQTGGAITVILPDLIAEAEELSDAELEKAAGGITIIRFPGEERLTD
jgi:hypothetical protein